MDHSELHREMNKVITALPADVMHWTLYVNNSPVMGAGSALSYLHFCEMTKNRSLKGDISIRAWSKTHRWEFGFVVMPGGPNSFRHSPLNPIPDDSRDYTKHKPQVRCDAASFMKVMALSDLLDDLEPNSDYNSVGDDGA